MDLKPRMYLPSQELGFSLVMPIALFFDADLLLNIYFNQDGGLQVENKETELSPVMAGDRMVDIFKRAMVLLAQKASDENKVDWAAILAENGLDVSILARSCLREDFAEAGEHLRQLLIVDDIGRELASRLAAGALRHGIEIEDREGSLAEHRLRVFGAVVEIYDAAAASAKDFPELSVRICRTKFRYYSWQYEAVRQKWCSF